jgi:hypothetical protein
VLSVDVIVCEAVLYVYRALDVYYYLSCGMQRVGQCNYTSLVAYVGDTQLEQQLVDAANKGKFCDALTQ